MKRLRLLLLAFAALTVGAGANTRVEVCHLPPGNPDNYHTLTVPSVALKAHLAHGDLEGSCGSYCGLFCNTNSRCFQDNGAFDPSTGRCICSSAPVDCSSPNSCLTSTGCDSNLGCQYSVNVGAPCTADDNACTADKCDGDGICQVGPHDLAAVGGTCSGPTMRACAYDKNCPEGETCAWSQSAPRFIDNGDQTVTDQRTCLMWEKKNTDGYSVHWVEREFTWSLPGSSDLTGTVKTEFLDLLNAGSGFAGHADWCLPTSAGSPTYPTGSDPELESILASGCTGDPCTDPIFRPTNEFGGYWSASTHAVFPEFAWAVSFGFFGPDYDPVVLGTKTGKGYARAVRSRSCVPVP